jgi:hypothetical protein
LLPKAQTALRAERVHQPPEQVLLQVQAKRAARSRLVPVPFPRLVPVSFQRLVPVSFQRLVPVPFQRQASVSFLRLVLVPFQRQVSSLCRPWARCRSSTQTNR